MPSEFRRGVKPRPTNTFTNGHLGKFGLGLRLTRTYGEMTETFHKFLTTHWFLNIFHEKQKISSMRDCMLLTEMDHPEGWVERHKDCGMI